jgi:hypothetical protein
MNQTNDIDDFRYISNTVNNRVLPQDQGSWDFYGPPNSDRTIIEVLEAFVGNCQPMPADIAEALGLPKCSTFTEGVQEIWNTTIIK